MSKSKVYFTDLRTKPGYNLLDKLQRLVVEAGIKNIDYKDKFVAIKIHFGEPGNLSYIRPNYAAKIVKLIKELGGKPFLTDANTLYSGRRFNAVDHIEAAMENGFNPMAVGCNVIIADGLKGGDYREIPINQKYCKTAKIASAIADSDIVISMTHFKGHEMTGFGGTLKNLGMGSGSIGGKLEMHSASKPLMKHSKCVSCGLCIKNCLHEAISFDENKKATIDYDKCVGCGQCVAVCRFDSATVKWNESADIANEKIAEYAYAVTKDKPTFHISFIMNVSPNCDCWNSNDVSIVPDIGMAASFDPVALDQACVDMVNSATALYATELSDKHYHEGQDKFSHIHPDTNWKVGLDHAKAIGVGTDEYELVIVK
ncbi:DUF362 domain-containing protein [Clostridium estertheticum]|uniref:DUF362 domain-containing protein n=1 Tax=Clostridium estertheticum TaxID=238834 RepID=UPI0013E8F842|nr:DUF362 domain-containing protein [Clostridium estertheticum]MBZ9689109.1 DUF362 domain-containing protein [Clostridium estertheticum]